MTKFALGVLAPIVFGKTLRIQRSFQSLPHVMAFPASSFAFGASKNVIAAERMAILAMGLFSPLGRKSFAAKNIFSLRDWLKMIWIDARSVATQMIKNQAIWDGADERYIGKSVGHDVPVSAILSFDVNHVVAVLVWFTMTWPALILGHILGKRGKTISESEVFHNQEHVLGGGYSQLPTVIGIQLT